MGQLYHSADCPNYLVVQQLNGNFRTPEDLEYVAYLSTARL